MVRSWKGRASRRHINCNISVHKPIWKEAGEKTPSYGFIHIEKDKGSCRINNRKNDREDEGPGRLSLHTAMIRAASF